MFSGFTGFAFSGLRIFALLPVLCHIDLSASAHLMPYRADFVTLGFLDERIDRRLRDLAQISRQLDRARLSSEGERQVNRALDPRFEAFGFAARHDFQMRSGRAIGKRVSRRYYGWSCVRIEI